jgi:hypothetical protein
MAEIEQIEYTPPSLAFPVEEGLVRACRDTFGPTLRAVVLTGSLARNEASYVLRDGQTVLQSDVEAIVVLHDDAALPSRASAHALRQLAQSYLAERGVSVEVSFSVVHGGYLRHLPPHIYSYELRSCGVVLYGEPSILSLIPDYSATDLSREDAWRLLSNRLIEQMGGAEKAETAVALRYRTVKLCIDLASSLLVFFGSFEAGYRARQQCLEELALEKQVQELPIPMDEFLPLVRLCTSAKLRPEIAVDLGEGFEGRVTRWAWQVWLWELQRMNSSGDDAGAEQMVRTFGRRQGYQKLLRGWLYVVRRMGWLGSARYWPRWSSLFAAGLTPRHAIYLAAYRWHDTCSGGTLRELSKSIEAVRDLLPVMGTGSSASVSAMKEQLVWNYKEFTVETRA